MNKYVVILSIFLFSTNVFAVPSITNVTSNGDTLVISGTDFGVHADNAPGEAYLNAAWTDFETGVADSDVWSGNSQIRTDLQRANSSYGARSTKTTESYTDVFGDPQTSQGSVSFRHIPASAQKTLIISGWFMLPEGTSTILGDETLSAQCKFISTTSLNNFGNQYWIFGGTAGGDDGMCRLNFEDGRIATNPVELRINNGVINEGTWHRFDLQINTDLPAGQKISYFRVDGKDYTDETNTYFKEAPDCRGEGGAECPREFSGLYITRYFIEPGWYVYFDDVYADYTWARVEISQNSTWSTTTRYHKEIQIPTAWSTTEITVNENQGSFTSGDTVYLYVIDADGAASNGYPITVGVRNTTVNKGSVGSWEKAANGLTIRKAP